MRAVLITGATGNVGGELIKIFERERLQVLAAVSNLEKAPRKMPANVEMRRMDFKDIETYGHALRSVHKVFLMLPPGLGDLNHTIFPFISACRSSHVEQIVLLSLQGADKAEYLPHRKIEREILRQGVPYTFLRPSYFNQNFLTTHRDEVKRESRIFIPAGAGKTAFVDTRDVAEVAFKALINDSHLGKAYELTGNERLNYFEVAEIFSKVLGRRISYVKPSLPSFVLDNWRRDSNLRRTIVMAAIYTAARFGRAAHLTTDLQNLLQRPPISFRQFVEDYKNIWL